MKKILFMLLLIACLGGITYGLDYDQDFYRKHIGEIHAARGNDPVWNFIGEVDDLIGGQIGTGDIYYVDSNVASENDGTSWAKAKDTLDEAIALCTANNGDIIYIAQGHEETLAAADGVDVDIAGITIIGLGDGADMPEFTFSATGSEFVIGAANTTVVNCRFIAGVSAITMGISVEAGGDNFLLYKCIFPKPTTNSWEFNDAIDIADGANDIAVIGCEYYNDEAGAAPNHFIEAGNGTAGPVRLQVVGNIIKGDFAVSAIWSDEPCDEAYIAYNTIVNHTADQHCIEFTDAGTGVIAYNLCYSSAEATTIDPGSMSCFENYTCTASDASGQISVRPDSGITTLNTTTISAIASAVDALDGVGVIGLCETNAVTTTVISAALGGFGNDAFLEGWSLVCIFDTGGTVGTAPSGEVRDITDYVSATGTFTTAAWSAALTAGDYVMLTPTHLLPATYGKIIYCDDGGSNGEGTSWQTAKTTLAAAEAIASAGDTILIGENHNQAMNAAEVIDVAGVTVIGMGEGDTRPLFDYDSAATELTLNAAGITVKNIRLRPSASETVAAVVIGASGLGCTLDNVAFEVGEASGDEFIDAISVNAAAEGLTVKNCTAWNTNATAGAQDTWLNLDAVTVDDCTATDNTVFGTYAEACIWSGAAVPVNVNIHRNTLSNLTSGQLCIELAALSTGVISYNTMYADTFGSVLQPGSASCIENYATNAINTSAYLVPSIDDELAEIGPGRIFYVDSGTPGAGDGRTWDTAVATLDAGVNLCTTLRGDTIYVAAGHTETVTTAFADLDLSNITVIGLGEGKSRPYFDYTGASGSMLINADNVTLRNMHFHANVDSILIAITVQTGSTEVTIEDCLFTTESATDEFDVCIDHAAANHGAVVRNCDFRMGAANAVSAVHFLDSDYAEIVGNVATGDYSTAVLHNETTASDHILVKGNDLFNGTIGGGENTEPGIEFKADTSGIITENNIVCLLDSPDLAIVAADCYLFDNKYNSLESSNGARDIGLEAGKTYATSWSETLFVSDDAWTVAGGPILITSLVGQITTAYDGALTHTWWCDATTAAQDIEFTDSVDIDAYLVGERIIYSNANPALITNLTAGATNGGGSSLMSPWFCPIGTIETLIEGPAAAAGAITWYMTYIPLVDGVTVTPQ
jgi:hypothetical protein